MHLIVANYAVFARPGSFFGNDFDFRFRVKFSGLFSQVFSVSGRSTPCPCPLKARKKAWMKFFSGVARKGHEKAHCLFGGLRAGTRRLERGFYFSPGGALQIDGIQNGSIPFIKERAEDTSFGLWVIRLSKKGKSRISLSCGINQSKEGKRA